VTGHVSNPDSLDREFDALLTAILRFLGAETALRRTSDRNETEVSPAGIVLSVGVGDVGSSTAVLVISDVNVQKVDSATTCYGVRYIIRLVPIHQANILVLRLSLYHPLHTCRGGRGQ